MSGKHNKITGDSRRLLGNEIPIQKRVEFSLIRIEGIGRYRAAKICKALEIADSARVSELDPNIFREIESYIKNEGWLVGPELRRFDDTQIRAEIADQSYRGRRHQRGLPVRTHRGARNGKTGRRLARHTRK